ncbi:LysM peptidoglycan-binding domain-containing protein [Paracoccus alkanivorans]|nr:LysM peptidoglycan-binding domain-containing protein [Paracoccus alkanivorans]
MLLEGIREKTTTDHVSSIPRKPVTAPSNPADEKGNGGPVSSTPPAEKGDVSSGIADAGAGAKDGVLIRDGVNKLNGDGDSAYLRITPEIKAQGNLRGVMVGGKAQLGADMRITQKGEGNDASYTLRYDKQSLGALTGEVGTDTVGKGGKAGAGRNSVNGRLKAEAGGQTFDAVEMSFDSKEDAIRAAETVQKLHMADAVGDGADLALLGLGPAGVAINGAAGAASGGGDNPLGNPLNEDGAPGHVSRAIAGVSEEDLSFLKNNVTAYESTIGTRGRLAAELKGDMKYLNIAGEGRLDGTQKISRRVELPTAEKDGRVSYTLEGGLRLSAKEKVQKGFNLNGLPIEPKFENRLELANATADISLNFTIPKGTELANSAGGRPLPEGSALSGTEGMRLDSITLGQQLEYRDQSLADPSRGDSQLLKSTVTLDNPDRLDKAAGAFFDGNFPGAAQEAGARIDLERQTILRSGVNTQQGAKVNLGVAEAEATVIFESGLDDVTNKGHVTIAPSQQQPDDPKTRTETRLPPAPQDDGKTLTVTPWTGATVRDAPDGARTGILQNGTFLRDEGERRTDAGGQEWLKVNGTDVNDEAVSGWVRADTVQAHSSATGAMDETGRINPTLEYERHDMITVAKDDNLWNLAEQHGVDPMEMVELNRDHLHSPSLVFKGDTVYLPGTARGPKPETVEVPAEPTKPGKPSDSGPQDSTPAPSGPAPSSPNPPSAPEESGSRPDTGSAPESGPETSPSDRPETESGQPDPAPQPGKNAPADPPAGRNELDRILKEYQVKDDETVEYTPDLGPIPIDVPFMDSKKMTRTEAELLDELGSRKGLLGLREFEKISSNNPNDPGLAYRTADEYYPQVGANGEPVKGSEDGHNDAFRHAYWNALMTDRFGEDFATSFGTAHEGVEGNPAAKEAMDLYNNEVGRRIASENPDASDEELAELVYDAVENGEMLVIDENGDLAYSNQVEVGQTGDARRDVMPGTQTPPDYESS